MKKTLSVFLAMLMLALTLVPAFAADGKSTVTFIGPDTSYLDADAYSFCKADELNGYEFVVTDPTQAQFVNNSAFVLPSYFTGATKSSLGGTKYAINKSTGAYVPDEENGTYYLLNGAFPLTDLTDDGITFLMAADLKGEVVFYVDGAPTEIGEYLFNSGKYMPLTDILFQQDKVTIWKRVITEADYHFYAPVFFDNGTAYEYDNGSTLVFNVMTNKKYDASTAVVTVNGEILPRNQNGVFAVAADRDLVIRVVEKDENNQDILLRNHYKMTLTSGNGYSVKPLKGENNKLVYYGDDYKFRVKITSGFSGDGMKVMAVRGSNDLAELLGDDSEFDLLYTLNLDGKSEQLSSDGVDEDGYRVFTVKNITTDCKIVVSGVKEESKVGILAMLKRILRAILHIFGITILDDMLTAYDVRVDANTPAAYAAGVEVTAYFSGKSVNNPMYVDPSNQAPISVLKGDSVTLELTKKSESQSVTVNWTGKPANYQEPQWVAHYNRYTAVTTWTATYFIDNIQGETTISVSAN